MVYFEDMGTTIDVPLGELETFLQSREHSSVHSDNVRNFEVVEQSDASLVLAYERRFDGRWRKSRTRMTLFPPYCAWLEELEGDFKGTRFVLVHRPDGKKTRVDVFGDVQCGSMDGEKLRKYWLGLLVKAHDEDELALRRYRARK